MWWKQKDLFGNDIPPSETWLIRDDPKRYMRLSGQFTHDPKRAFDGATYQPDRDHARLSEHLMKVFNLMKDGNWRTLNQIAWETGCSPTGASARLRDLRKAKYGSRVVERRHVRKGLFEYRVRT